MNEFGGIFVFGGGIVGIILFFGLVEGYIIINIFMGDFIVVG